ncbi:hypothetical protein [Streptomyces sp. SID14515]|uniref:hypothetical protein n=1 Tax=Streptomyces sp. SID14515 TaxID=2706074 RepID=UPI0013C83696|nr:hypothetical protein [Streptomyces sp. SID14515]NEB35886.1 hypothetical protein [Streptomyces sp. SID14515]
MVGTVTVGDVLKLGGTLATVGKGKVPHPLKDGKTICKGQEAEAQNFEHTPETTVCANCAKLVRQTTWTKDQAPAEETSAEETAAEETVAAKDGETAEETPADKPDALTEVSAILDRMEDDATYDPANAEEDGKRVEALLLELPNGKRTANRLRLREAQDAIAEAVKEADKAAAKAAAAASKALGVLETTDYHAVPGAEELAEEGAAKVAAIRDAIGSAAEAANEAANVQLHARRRFRNKDGLPDIDGKSQAWRDWSNDLNVKAEIAVTSDLPEDEKKRRTLIQGSVRAQMSQVRVDYIRALDHSPEEAALFLKAANPVKVKKDEKVSDAVFRHFGIASRSIAEKKRDDRAAKAITAGTRSAKESADQAAKTAKDKKTPVAVKAATVVETALRAFEKLPMDAIQAANAEGKERIQSDAKEMIGILEKIIQAAEGKA